MISFGETFEKVRECFGDSGVSSLIPKLDSVTIIRDVQGKIRLFLEFLESNTLEESELEPLAQLLTQKLASYYGHDIWFPTGEKDGYKALIQVIKSERAIAHWHDNLSPFHWYILERHIAKQAWTGQRIGELPWPFERVEQGHKPAIVSFFSFKGGVGRTSALAATALTLARNGHRVAVVDLDLEAPGLATIFGESVEDSSGVYGVIDYLLEKRVQGAEWKPTLESLTDDQLLGDRGETLQLFPAGTVDENYLEKLARLDFQNLADGTLWKTIQEMLIEVAHRGKPLDFIFVDARAGFHDIGGLAITSLSHAVVIFGLASRQSWAGLKQVVRHLAQPSIDERLPIILAHSLAPSLGTLGRESELQQFREKAYTIFHENYYGEEETVPNSTNEDEPFFPVVIPYENSLRGDIALFSRDSTPEEKSRLRDLVQMMTSRPYQKIASKLCDLFGRNFEK
jgi:cellulose biosynthesis protein BcsQ